MTSKSALRRYEIGAVLLLMVPLSSPTLACSQAVASVSLGPTAIIGVGLLQARSSVDNLSARAALAANDAVLGAAARLRFLIEALRNSESNILDQRLKDLDPAQKTLFATIQSGIATLQADADEPMDQARECLNEIGRLAASAARALADPVALDSSPVILPPAGLGEIPFSLLGQHLSKADPRLLFGDVEATRTALSEQEVLFTVPQGVLRGSERTPLSSSGRLLLAVPNCRWRIRCKPAWRAYTVSVVILPTHLATVQISFDRKTNQRIYDRAAEVAPATEGAPPAEVTPAEVSSEKLYSSRVDYATDDLTVMSCTRKVQAPHAAGYFIDTESLSSKVMDSQGENKWRIVETSANGFTIELCAQPQMGKSGTITGSISVETTWKEYRMGEVISARESLAPQELAWGTDIKESLPADIHSLEVDLEYFDGSRAAFTQTAGDRYVQINWDAETHQFLLTPRLRASIPEAN